MPCEDIEAKPITAVEKVVPPALPIAKENETRVDKEQYSNVLRIFFNRLTDAVGKLITVVDGNTLNITDILLELTDLQNQIDALQVEINNIFATSVRPGVINSVATYYLTDDEDENNLIIITNAAAISVELHLSAPIGFIAHFHQGGAGQITISSEAGGTVVSSRSLVTSAQGSALSVFKVSATGWIAVGDQE